jgi:ketosteroid isomerase-like protein
MRRLLSNTFFLALGGIFLLGPAPSRADEEADRAELRKLRALYEEVVKSDDLTKLMPYLPPSLTAVTPTGEQVKGPNELQEYFKKIWGMIGRGGTYQVKVNLGSTDLYNDIAVSYGTTDEFIKTAEGTEYQFPMLWTAVSRKENGAWKVIRMHGSIDPLTNVFVTTQLNTLKWVYGVGGLIVGLILGILTRFIRFRRS